MIDQWNCKKNEMCYSISEYISLSSDEDGLFNVCKFTRDNDTYYNCKNQTVTLENGGYTICDIGGDSDWCGNFTAPKFCTYTQPSYNRLFHNAIPIVFYLPGIIFSFLALLALMGKEEWKNLFNFQLWMLSLWRVLFLGCLIGEWIVYQNQTGEGSLIKDPNFLWISIGCFIYGNDTDGFCKWRKEWLAYDPIIENRSIMDKDTTAMYWFHILARLFQMTSVYQTLAIAIFRTLAVYRPFMMNKYLNLKVAVVCTSCCLILSTLLHVPNIAVGVASYKIQEANTCREDFMNLNDTTKRNFTVYKNCVKDVTTNIIANNPMYSAFMKDRFKSFFEIYHIILYNVVMFMALPFVLLLILDVLLLRELWKNTSSDDITAENKAYTKIIVTVVTVFLISFSVKPLYIIDIFYLKGKMMELAALNSCTGYFILSVIIIALPVLNSIVNFWVYFSLRKLFREKMMGVFKCRRNTYVMNTEHKPHIELQKCNSNT